MTRIALINGKGSPVGYGTQKGNGRVYAPESPATEANKKPVFIKLPREVVDSGKRKGINRHRTKAFSHDDENLGGRTAVIWCDGDHGGFHSAFIGTISSAATTTDGIGRNYTLKDCTPISRAEWNTTYARLAGHKFET